MEAKVIKGYKVFDPDFTCKGYKFEENKEFTHKGKLVICKSGFHFCVKASDCFNYYSFDPKNIVCEVEARGQIVKEENGDSKYATDVLYIGKKLSWQEVLAAANEGSNNTGFANSGNWNSGNWNSGDRNSGNWNSGNRNSGYRNSGYRNSGAFCADNNPVIWLFDKPTSIKVKEWEKHEAISIMKDLLENTIWIEDSLMSKEEKKTYPSYETTGGYLKVKTMHEAWADMWNNLDDEKKKIFTSLPNFDAKKFKIITGIDVKLKGE